MWNLKKPPKLIETKQMGGSQRRGQGVGEMGVGGEEVQTSRYKINSKAAMYSMVTTVNLLYCIFES